MKLHKRWLYLLLTGWMLLEISACAQAAEFREPVESWFE